MTSRRNFQGDVDGSSERKRSEVPHQGSDHHSSRRKNALTKKQVAAFLESFVELAYRETKKNKKFLVPGLGFLKLNKRAARLGRNPATGDQIKIPAKTVIKFTVAKAGKDAILGASN